MSATMRAGSRRARPQGGLPRQIRRAFTLVELLVVIAIIGILVALLLPAIQAAREAARRSQCSNHLKQMGIASLMHHDTYGFYPSGGWEWRWVGDPDRGAGKEQPGTWTYAILPFIEQGNVHQLGSDGDADTITQQQRDGAAQRESIPISEFNCPSRRPAMPFQISPSYPYQANNSNASLVTQMIRGDYAGCVGFSSNVQAGSQPNAVPVPATYVWPNNGTSHHGVIFRLSEIAIRHIEDGTSKTYLIGEKYVDPIHYTTGDDYVDTESVYSGGNDDNLRTLHPDWAPLPDIPQVPNQRRFGSAHPGIWQVLMCDGSVQGVSYDTANEINCQASSRNGETCAPPAAPPPRG